MIQGLQVAGANSVGICVECSELIRCDESINFWCLPDYKCVHHPWCANYPIYYPIPKFNEQFYPLLSGKIISILIFFYHLQKTYQITILFISFVKYYECLSDSKLHLMFTQTSHRIVLIIYSNKQYNHNCRHDYNQCLQTATR